VSDLSEAKAKGNFLLLAALTISVVALGYELRWGFLRHIAAFLGFWSAVYVDVALLVAWVTLIVVARRRCGRVAYLFLLAAPVVFLGPFTDLFILGCGNACS
jgi:hypothetical protein